MNRSRDRQCEGKKRHRTERGAMIAIALTGQATGQLTLVFYKCPHCGFYHVGHQSKREARQLHYTRLLKLIDRANES